MEETCQKASAIWGNEVNSYPPISLSAGGIGKKKDEVLMHKVATIILSELLSHLKKPKPFVFLLFRLELQKFQPFACFRVNTAHLIYGGVRVEKKTGDSFFI